MDKESILQLQKIDCNCNDCIYLVRDLEALKKHKQTYKGTGIMDNLQYGFCNKQKLNKTFIPNTCMIENQNCFKHRKD